MGTTETGDQLAVPQASKADRIRTLVLGTIGEIPFGGSAASAIVEVLWGPAYEKRVGAFLNLLVAELRKQTERIDNVEELIQRDIAVTIGIAGAYAAGKTHDQTKLRYLANAVASITVDSSWDTKADFASLLLQFVDDLTVTHVRVMTVVSDPKWRKEFSVENSNAFVVQRLLAEAFPDVEPLFVQSIVSDLIAKNLVQHAATWDGMPIVNGQGLTTLGQSLMDLITTTSDPESSST